jgi:ferredoxin
MARNLQVTVDKNLCVSNQWCISNLPAVFKEDANGLAEAGDLSSATEEELVEAGFNCPVGAIAVVDADTGEDLLA